MASRWIQKAIKRPGALRRWFKTNRKKLKKILGYDPLTKRGTIKIRALKDTYLLAVRSRIHKRGKLRVSKKTLSRLRLAITLNSYRPRKKRSRSLKRKRRSTKRKRAR